MASLLQYKCPKCGGNIEFDSSVQKPKCEHCGTEFDVADLRAWDEEIKGEKADNINWQSENEEWAEKEAGEAGMKVYICESCGGEIITEETTAATKCPWCDSPVVVKGSVAGSLRPDYILPFRLEKDAAKEAFRNHMKGKRFLPDLFYEDSHLDEIKGVYVPFWLFDADADANVRFRGSKVRHWSAGNYFYTETSHFDLIRNGSLSFDNIPVDGSKKMADDLMESVEPFDWTAMEKFQTSYMSGYLADKYDVSREESEPRANKRMKGSAEEALLATTAGFKNIRVQNSALTVKKGRTLYALLPLWILNTTWKGKKFTFAMNGQTGKFVGNLPRDNKKMWLFILANFGIFTAAFTAAALIFLGFIGML